MAAEGAIGLKDKNYSFMSIELTGEIISV